MNVNDYFVPGKKWLFKNSVLLTYLGYALVLFGIASISLSRPLERTSPSFYEGIALSYALILIGLHFFNRGKINDLEERLSLIEERKI